MTHHDNEWEIKSLQLRYKAVRGLELTGAQAEKVLLYEAEKTSGSCKYFFSDWEELDYEQDKFQEILTPVQFENYLREKERQLKQIEESLIDNDKQYLAQLNAAEDRIVYYQEILIPALRKNLMPFNITFSSGKEKADFLKSEYKKYLIDAKKKLLVEHYRHSKTFQPILLKLSLLGHKQACLYPDYFAFKTTMDVATKAVAACQLERLSGISEKLADALKETMDKLKDFNNSNTTKHLGKLRGWHTTLPINDKTEELMFTILLDPEKYIC